MIFDPRPVPDPGVDLGGGIKRSKFDFFRTFSNQIKGNDGCSNMVAYIMPADTPPPPESQKVKILGNSMPFNVNVNIS